MSSDMVTIKIVIGDVEHELTPEQARTLYQRLKNVFEPIIVSSSWSTSKPVSQTLTVGNTE